MSAGLSLWWIPLLPLAGFVANLLLGRRLGKSFVSAVGVGSVLLSTGAAYSRLLPFAFGDRTPAIERFADWIAAGDFAVDLSMRLDPLSALMLSFVTFVGLLIHVYSIGYMRCNDGTPPQQYLRAFSPAPPAMPQLKQITIRLSHSGQRLPYPGRSRLSNQRSDPALRHHSHAHATFNCCYPAKCKGKAKAFLGDLRYRR